VHHADQAPCATTSEAEDFEGAARDLAVAITTAVDVDDGVDILIGLVSAIMF
jgi:hypothetical protein